MDTISIYIYKIGYDFYNFYSVSPAAAVTGRAMDASVLGLSSARAVPWALPPPRGPRRDRRARGIPRGFGSSERRAQKRSQQPRAQPSPTAWVLL